MLVFHFILIYAKKHITKHRFGIGYDHYGPGKRGLGWVGGGECGGVVGGYGKYGGGINPSERVTFIVVGCHQFLPFSPFSNFFAALK